MKNKSPIGGNTAHTRVEQREQTGYAFRACKNTYEIMSEMQKSSDQDCVD